MLHICLDTSPLTSGHSVRGVGAYTRFLQKALEQRSDVTLTSEPTNQTQVVHYPFFDLFSQTLPIKKKQPTVVTIHDVIPLLFPAQYPVGIKGTLRHWLQKWSLRSVARIVTDSVASAADIEKYLGVHPDRISVVPLAASPGLAPQQKSVITEVRKNLELPKKFVLYVGDINYNKNAPQLIKMLKYLPEEISLVCVGAAWHTHDIPEWKAIEQQMTMSEVASRVRMITSIPAGDQTTLSAMYSAASCYVQPSLAEGFGLPVLEALSCGTPVVSSNTTSLPEVGGTAVVYAAPDAESLAAAVLSVFERTPEQAAQAREVGLQWAAHFSWERVAEQMVELYKKAVEKKR